MRNRVDFPAPWRDDADDRAGGHAERQIVDEETLAVAFVTPLNSITASPQALGTG